MGTCEVIRATEVSSMLIQKTCPDTFCISADKTTFTWYRPCHTIFWTTYAFFFPNTLAHAEKEKKKSIKFK